MWSPVPEAPVKTRGVVPDPVVGPAVLETTVGTVSELLLALKYRLASCAKFFWPVAAVSANCI